MTEQTAVPVVETLSLVPIYEKIIVKRDPLRTKTKSGIDIPDDAQHPTSCGTVMAVGCGRLTEVGIIPLLVKVGDRIIFGIHGGLTMPAELELGADLVTLREDEVLAIIRGEA